MMRKAVAIRWLASDTGYGGCFFGRVDLMSTCHELFVRQIENSSSRYTSFIDPSILLLTNLRVKPLALFSTSFG